MPRLVAILLLALGATLVAVGLRQSSRARETGGWTRTTGRVLESRVERLAPTDEQQWERFALVIRYAYEARGRAHESGQIWIGSTGVAPSDSPGPLRRWIERFPEGAEAPVWFDPADPRQAVLVREIPRGQVGVILAVGAALAAAGLYALARLAWR
jgi:hypothetical protein